MCIRDSDNFCSYCMVPYVRGRERSRRSADILAEFKSLIDQGYKDITLLGQNVNSYGKGLDEGLDFSDLLAMLDKVEGDYRIRFMTSHPKDATHKPVSYTHLDVYKRQAQDPRRDGRAGGEVPK